MACSTLTLIFDRINLSVMFIRQIIAFFKASIFTINVTNPDINSSQEIVIFQGAFENGLLRMHS